MVNNQGFSAPDLARHCNHLEMISLFLPNIPEEENISLDTVIESIDRYQKEPDMFNPPSFMLTPELGNKSSEDRYPRELQKPDLPSFMLTPEREIMSSVDYKRELKKPNLHSFLLTPERRIMTSVDLYKRELKKPILPSLDRVNSRAGTHVQCRSI